LWLGYNKFMLDIKFIRENPDKVKENILRRGVDPDKVNIDRLLELDTQKKDFQTQIQLVRTKRNQLNDDLKDPKKRTTQTIQSGKDIRVQLEKLETELSKIEIQWQQIMDWIPNMLAPDVPTGKDDSENPEIKAWVPGTGYLSSDKLGSKDVSKKWMPTPGFPILHHVDIGKKLDIIDTEQSATVSGSRFYYLKNQAVLLQWAVFDLLKTKLLQEGFTPMSVPLLVRDRALYGSSHFPGDADQVYKIESKYVEENKDLYLVGSSEPSLFAYYMDKTLKASDLPQKVFAISPCFRSEVGSWGKDVRGIKRCHQFTKLEMDTLTTPDKSMEMLEYLLSINEWLLQQLQLPYHVILMCSGDAGYYATHKKYDFEVWLPGQNEFMELGSDTTAADYQARRFNTKYTDEKGETHFVHNVNDTGITDRVIIAILENYQNADGTVTVPEVLRPLVGFDKISPTK
jgi:seryl-tRNA synthetase